MFRKIILLLFFIIQIIYPGFSQEEPRRFAADRIRYSKEISYENDFLFSIGVNTDFSVGDWKKFSNMGLGPEGGLWFHFNNQWSINSRFGFNRWIGKQYVMAGTPLAKYEHQSQWYIYGGGRYNFSQTWWINPEIGYSHISFDQKEGGNFSWGLSAGADIFAPSSIIGIDIGYQQMNFDNNPHNHVGLRLRIYIGGDREKYDETENK